MRDASCRPWVFELLQNGGFYNKGVYDKIIEHKTLYICEVPFFFLELKIKTLQKHKYSHLSRNRVFFLFIMLFLIHKQLLYDNTIIFQSAHTEFRYVFKFSLFLHVSLSP